MSNTLTGKLIIVNDTQTFTSGFQKREFVIEETEGKYPQQIKFEVVKDKCEALDDLRIGSEMTVHYNIRGNEHNGKHYVSLQAWKIEGESGGRPISRPTQTAHNTAKSNAYQPEPEDGDDIPF